MSSGGKSTQLSYLSKNKDTLIENDSSKSESHPVKVLIILINHFTFLMLSKPDGIIVLFYYFTDSQGHTSTLRSN